MARLNLAVSTASTGSARTSVSQEAPSPSTTKSVLRRRTALSPSSAALSDKENQDSSSVNSHGTARRKSQMSSRTLPTPTSDEAASPRTNKRRRVGEFSISDVSHTGDDDAAQRDGAELNRFYDPDQPQEVRRRVRKGMRDLSRRFQDSRDELLAPENNDLYRVIEQANSLMDQVRQTADATIDSRLLVSASDLTLKKTTQLVLGDSATGIDVDEFVSKCITYMRHGGPPSQDDQEPAPVGNRRHGPRRSSMLEVGDEDEDGDAFNWELLGRDACFPTNLRPPVPSFLLGPLSLQKRVRASQPRRARLRADAQAPVSKPEELKAADLQRAETSNLTALCKNIRTRLNEVIAEGTAGVDAEGHEDMTDEELAALMRRHHVTRDGHVSLFEFAINPESFGQTVENLFYISFLVREGTVAISKDQDGLPTLYPSSSRSLSEQRTQQVSKHQAVFSLDWPTWEGLIKAFDIRNPLIPHRVDENGESVAPGAWYG